MGIFDFKKKEVLNSDPLVNLIMGWTDKMINGEFPYDKRVVKMSVELMDMDCKMCMEKAEFVLNFFRENKINGVKNEALDEKLKEDLKLMKEKYEMIKEMREKMGMKK